MVLEGLLLFALPELREQLDVKIFVDTDADIRILRRIQRDTAERGRSIESVIDQYLESVRPMHLEHILRQIEPDSGNLRHDRSSLWILADPPWHSDAVGGRSHHQRP